MAEFDINIVKDPRCFEQNRLAPHSDHIPFVNYREAVDNVENSLRECLNGNWFFHFAKNFALMPQGFEKDDFDVSAWSTIKVPGHFETQGYGKPHYTNVAYPWDGRENVLPGQIPTRYNAVGSYVTFFEKRGDWSNCFITLEGVDSAYALYLNGHYVGYATGSFTPSDFDLSPYIREGRNRLAVRVFKYSSGSHLEDQDFWRLSGIFRSVYLYTKPEVHLEDIFVKASLADDYISPILKGSARLNHDGALQLSLVDENGKVASKCFKAKANEDFEFSLDVSKLSLKPWSAEHPNLYTLICQCLPQELANESYESLDDDNLDGVLKVDASSCEVSLIKIGFRRFEMKYGLMHINGKRIVFNGVNRHEFSSIGGRCVPESEIYEDLLTMKRNNINAVRTSHYPNSSIFYHYCDELGLYVIDETNLETHGTWQIAGIPLITDLTIPNDHQEWHDAVLARGQAMLERDKNHACVIIWSCGNESAGGSVIFDLSQFFRTRDPSRLVHYEGIFHDRRFNDTSDMESQMYTTKADVEKFLKEHSEKPFILCEYTHAMGQSNGGMKEYTDLAKVEPRYQGGFIWDYKDQAFLVQNTDGVEYFAYGGDFDDHPTEFNFSGNGITFADGSETSKMAEVKYNYQQFVLEPNRDTIKITNYSLFTNTFDYLFRVRLLLNGTVVGSYTDAIDLEPGKSCEIPVNMALLTEDLNANEGEEFILQASFETRESTAWAEAGFEVAYGEAILHKPDTYIKLSNNGKELELLDTKFNYGVIGETFRMLFSNSVGGLVSYQIGGIEYLKGTPKINFWRAPTDNDRGNKMPWRDSIWKQAGCAAKCVEHSAENLGDFVRIKYKMQLATLPIESYATVTYSVYKTGQVKVDVDYIKAEGLPEIPEFGIIMPIKPEFMSLDYYGRGPMPNYPDRKFGYKLGYYSGSTTFEEFEPYLRPQECGNHCDTRYFHLRDEKSDHGIMFSCVDEPFNFSALPWSPHQIEEALHPFELANSNYTFVKISSKMMGVGGDNSWGAPILDKYRIENQDCHLSFVFAGF